ncbi:MAG TPA: hypothetical protein VH951_08375, partial [Dehalococcoidia bacterium]
MTELFGVDMSLIMYVLLAFLALALLTVGFVAFRNPVMFKIGVRNIPRRRAQTTLIVLGLMLSSLIISAAFTTGDTVARSLTSQVLGNLGSVDETVQLRGSIGDQTVDQEDSTSFQRDTGFAASDAQPLINELRANPTIDGVVPMFSDVAVAVNPAKRLSTPVFTLTGLDPNAAKDVSDIVDVKSGKSLKLSDLAPGEMYITQSGAEDINVKPGDAVQINALDKQNMFKVRAVVRDKRLAGSGGISVRLEGGVVPLELAQNVFGAQGKLTTIAISNSDGVSGSDEVVAATRAAAEKSTLQLTVLDIK